jgi:hypothetical protein
MVCLRSQRSREPSAGTKGVPTDKVTGAPCLGVIHQCLPGVGIGVWGLGSGVTV